MNTFRYLSTYIMMYLLDYSFFKSLLNLRRIVNFVLQLYTILLPIIAFYNGISITERHKVLNPFFFFFNQKRGFDVFL